MNLYEVTNGYYVNENYIRCYSWAKDKEQALELATENFKVEAKREGYKVDYWENLRIILLLSPDNLLSFATIPTNHGWEDVDE